MTMMFSRRTLALALCAGAFTNGAFAQASSNKPPRRYHITVTKVKPDMVRTYEALVKNELTPALKKAGTTMRAVWRTAVFGEAFEYVAATPITSMARYDEPNSLIKALGAALGADLGDRLRKCYESNHSYVVWLRDELSIESNSKEAPKLATVTTIHVVPGHALQFENFIKSEILPVLKKAGVTDYWVHQTMLGGDPSEYVILSLVPNMAELDKPSPMIRVLGREGWMKLTGKIAGVVSSVEMSVTRLDPELSILPAQ